MKRFLLDPAVLIFLALMAFLVFIGLRVGGPWKHRGIRFKIKRRRGR